MGKDSCTLASPDPTKKTSNNRRGFFNCEDKSKGQALYDQLGVATDAKPAEIRAAYQQRVREIAVYAAANDHDEKLQREAMLANLERARRILTNTLWRILYDKHGENVIPVLENRMVSGMDEGLGIFLSIFLSALLALVVTITILVQVSLIAAKLDGSLNTNWVNTLMPLYFCIAGLMLHFLVSVATRLKRRFCPSQKEIDAQKAAAGGCPNSTKATITELMEGELSTPTMPFSEEQKRSKKITSYASTVCFFAFFVLVILVVEYVVWVDKHSSTEEGKAGFDYSIFAVLMVVEVAHAVARHEAFHPRGVRVQLAKHRVDNPSTFLIATRIVGAAVTSLYKPLCGVLWLVKVQGPASDMPWVAVVSPIFAAVVFATFDIILLSSYRAEQDPDTTGGGACCWCIVSTLQTLCATATVLLLALKVDGHLPGGLNYGMCLAPVIVLFCVYFLMACGYFYWAATLVVEDPDSPQSVPRCPTCPSSGCVPGCPNAEPSGTANQGEVHRGMMPQPVAVPMAVMGSSTSRSTAATAATITSSGMSSGTNVHAGRLGPDSHSTSTALSPSLVYPGRMANEGQSPVTPIEPLPSGHDHQAGVEESRLPTADGEEEEERVVEAHPQGSGGSPWVQSEYSSRDSDTP